MVPLVSSFLLSRMANNKAWVEPLIDPAAPDGWRFKVRTGALSKAEEERLKKGTKAGRGTNFECVLTGSTISPDYVRNEGLAGRLGTRLMAIVAEGQRSRMYLAPTRKHEEIAASAVPGDTNGLDVEMPNNARWFSGPGYGIKRYVDIFTPRQLVALTTFSDVVAVAREKVLADAHVARMANDKTPLHAGGVGATAYAEAIATMLAFNVTSVANSLSQVCTWDSGGPGWGTKVRNTFSRQALPMTWDFAEIGPFSGNSGSFEINLDYIVKSISSLQAKTHGNVACLDATTNIYSIPYIVFSTDPPYYDNIGYADLSDFFYIWLKRSLSGIWPELFRRLTTPKAEELIATPYRHGSKEAAEAFFIRGMGEAVSAMRKAATDGEPLTIFYAFKQSEVGEDGVTSAGWASFLQAIVDAGLGVDGTWPMRTELSNRMIGKGANALASSVVLVCRKRTAHARVVARAEFIRTMRRELPEAIDDIRKAGVGPVDMQQSVIGPGMGVFTRFTKVLEDDDTAMTVKTALSVINRVWEEIETELDANFDAETQVALAWFATYGFDTRASGELITLANAKNVPLGALFAAGVFKDLHGRACLMARSDLASDWDPARDNNPTVWECVQHTARVLAAEDGGAEGAASLVARMGPKAREARLLAERLFLISTQKGWASEALVYNQLAQEWAHLEDIAPGVGALARLGESAQGALALAGGRTG
jgi:putative DNA methylase